ncbi:MAG: DinB family protein, partial [Candidatus Rokuibacteriota bacterium]
MLSSTTALRLKSQLDALPLILAGAAPDALARRPAPGEWSAQENLAHLARHHDVFLTRLRRVLVEDAPDLGRYRAEEDP